MRKPPLPSGIWMVPGSCGSTIGVALLECTLEDAPERGLAFGSGVRDLAVAGDCLREEALDVRELLVPPSPSLGAGDCTLGDKTSGVVPRERCVAGGGGTALSGSSSDGLREAAAEPPGVDLLERETL